MELAELSKASDRTVFHVERSERLMQLEAELESLKMQEVRLEVLCNCAGVNMFILLFGRLSNFERVIHHT